MKNAVVMYSCNCGDRIEITGPGNRRRWNRILPEQKQPHRSRGLREDPPGLRPTVSSSSPLDAQQLKRDTLWVPWTSIPVSVAPEKQG